MDKNKNQTLMLVINTWRTKSISWLVKFYDPVYGTLDEMPDLVDIEMLKTLREMVINLPVVIRLPKHFSKLSLPRYYLVVVTNEKIVDIVGVKRDKTPTKWSYRLGYWHPQIQWLISSSIRLAEKTEKR